MSSVYFDGSKAYPLVYKALDYRSIRQDMISSNIANVDTPFYRPKDVDFESFLAKQEDKIFNHRPDLELKMAQTSPKHLQGKSFDENKPAMFFRDGHLAKNDGNSVDLDVETSEMGKNNVMYQALTTALKKHKGIVSYAIDSGKNL